MAFISKIKSGEKFCGAAKGKTLIKKVSSCVPTSLREMLQSRIDLLDRSRKLVLQCAAVIGKEFAFRIIELFDIIREGLLARLYSLKSIELLDDRVTPEGLEFLFRHHITREVAYQLLLESQRKDLHKLLAERLEQKFADRLEGYYHLLAYHYSHSENREKSAQYLNLAGDRALAVAATDEAIDYYQEALKNIMLCERSLANKTFTTVILRSKGRVHRLTGEIELAIESFKNSLKLTKSLDNKKEIAALLNELGLTFIQIGQYDSAMREFRKSLRIAKEEKDPQLLGMVYNGMGVCAWERGLLKRAKSYYEKVCNLKIEDSNPKLAADACNNLALIMWKNGQLLEALRHFKIALKLQHKNGSKYGIGLALMNMAIIEEDMGKYFNAEKHYKEVLKLAERIRFSRLLSAAYTNIANLSLVIERNLEAQEYGAKSYEIAKQINDKHSMAIALENLILSHIAFKQFNEAKKLLKEARSIVQNIGDKERLFSLELVEFELLLSRGIIQWRESKIEQAKKILEKNSYNSELPRLLRLHAYFHYQKGHLDKAIEKISQSSDIAKKQNNRTEEVRAGKLMKLFQSR